MEEAREDVVYSKTDNFAMNGASGFTGQRYRKMMNMRDILWNYNDIIRFIEIIREKVMRRRFGLKTVNW